MGFHPYRWRGWRPRGAKPGVQRPGTPKAARIIPPSPMHGTRGRTTTIEFRSPTIVIAQALRATTGIEIQMLPKTFSDRMSQKNGGDWSSCFTNYKAGQALEGVRRERVRMTP